MSTRQRKEALKVCSAASAGQLTLQRAREWVFLVPVSVPVKEALAA